MSVKNHDPNGVYSHGIVLALEESIDLLQDQITRYRRVIRYLRKQNGELRRLKSIQVMNDIEFRSMCLSDLPIESDVLNGEGGLPDPQAS